MMNSVRSLGFNKSQWLLPKDHWLFTPIRTNNNFLSKKRNLWIVGFVCSIIFLVSTYFLFLRETFKPPPPPKPEHKEPEPIIKPYYLPAPVDENHDERFAYVTFLASTESDESDDPNADVYFTATRILVWQLLHDPATKTAGIDVVVMVGPDVGQKRRDRLAKDGAIVRPVELLHGNNDTWIVPEFERWKDVMTKLRVWEMEEYDRVLMLDGDMLLQSPLDNIFNDPGAQVMRTKPNVGHVADEPQLPEQYMLGTYMEIQNTRHSWPPKEHEHYNPGYFNAGFFLLKPDRKMLEYFLGLMDIEGRFSPKYPEQNLLNYAFRWDGGMPWAEIADTWNIRFTNPSDIDGGVVSMHEKWWRPRSGGERLRDFMLSKRWQMHGYYMGRDGTA